VPLLFGGFAAIYWVLAEGFVRGKRRLPATASTLLFVYDGALSGQLLTGQLLGASSGISHFAADDTGFLAFAAVLLAIALVRFRLPLLVLALALSIVALALALLNAPTLWIMGACGLVAILGAFDQGGRKTAPCGRCGCSWSARRLLFIRCSSR